MFLPSSLSCKTINYYNSTGLALGLYFWSWERQVFRKGQCEYEAKGAERLTIWNPMYHLHAYWHIFSALAHHVFVSEFVPVAVRRWYDQELSSSWGRV